MNGTMNAALYRKILKGNDPVQTTNQCTNSHDLDPTEMPWQDLKWAVHA